MDIELFFYARILSKKVTVNFFEKLFLINENRLFELLMKILNQQHPKPQQIRT